jgi:hypothetical protein
MDNTEPVPVDNIAEFERLIYAHMETSACTIPQLIRFCAEIMAKQKAGRYRPRKNKH